MSNTEKTDFWGRDTSVDHPYFDPQEEEPNSKVLSDAGELLGVIFNWINRGETPADIAMRHEIMLFHVRPDLSRHHSLESIGHFCKPDPTGCKSGASRQHVHDVSKSLFQFIPCLKTLNRKPNKSRI